MQRIYYGETSFLLADDVATALAAYLDRLIDVGTTGSVTVPAEHVDGSVAPIDLLLTPTSIIGFEPSGRDAEPDLHDTGVVRVIHSRIKELEQRT